MKRDAEHSVDAYLDTMFQGSFRLPLAVWTDRENVRDWIAFEAEEIRADGATDPQKAERWALARFDASGALKRALIPEQDAASPRPLRLCVAAGIALEMAFLALLRINFTLRLPRVWPALAMAAALLLSRMLLVRAAERIQTLRAQRTDGRIALVATLGATGWAICFFAWALPARRAQRRLIARLSADDMGQGHQADARERGEEREPRVSVLP